MAKIERDRRTPKGVSIMLERLTDDGKAEFVRGSLKALRIEEGDLVIIRIADKRHDVIAKVYQRVSALLARLEANATLVAMPADLDIERLSASQTEQLLETLRRRR